MFDFACSSWRNAALLILTKRRDWTMTVTRLSISGLTLAIGLAISVVACSGSSAQENTDSDTRLLEATDDSNQASVKKTMNTREQIAFSRDDLAARLDIDKDAVSLSGATPVTWRSGALGCPEPGMNYTQALVPGVWIMMRAGNKAYRYHSVPGGQPFYCPDDRAEPPVTGAGAD